MSELTELRPIGKKTSIPELMLAIKNQAWIFEKPIEKLIIAGCFGWTIYSLGKIVLLWLIKFI